MAGMGNMMEMLKMAQQMQQQMKQNQQAGGAQNIAQLMAQAAQMQAVMGQAGAGAPGGAPNMEQLAMMTQMAMQMQKQNGASMGAMAGLTPSGHPQQQAPPQQFHAAGAPPARSAAPSQEIITPMNRPRTSSAAVKPAPNLPRLSGWAEKQGGFVRNWKKRFFVLTEYVLKYYASETDQQYKGFVPLKQVVDVNTAASANARLALNIAMPGRTYIMRFQTEKERDLWYSMVKQQVAIAKGRQPTISTKARAATLSGTSTQRPVPASTLAAVQSPTPAPVPAAATPSSSRTIAKAAPSGRVAAKGDIRSEPTVFELDVDYPKNFSESSYEKLKAMVLQMGAPVAVQAPRGSGLTSFMRKFADRIQSEPATEALPGWHLLAALVCPACRHTQVLAPNNATYSVEVDENTAKTADGAYTIRDGDACTKCAAKNCYVEVLVFSEDEIMQMAQMLFATNTNLDVIVLRCPQCLCSGFPMSAEGLCYDAEGLIMTRSGQVMANGDSVEWKSAWPHLRTSCTACDLVHVPLQLDLAQIRTLMHAFPASPVYRAPNVMPILAYVEIGPARACYNDIDALQTLCTLFTRTDRMTIRKELNSTTNELIKTLTSAFTSASVEGSNRAIVIVSGLDNMWLDTQAASRAAWLLALASMQQGVQVVVSMSESATLSAVKTYLTNSRELALVPVSDDQVAASFVPMWKAVTALKLPEPDALAGSQVRAKSTQFSPLYARLVCSLAQLENKACAEVLPMLPNSVSELVNVILEKMEARVAHKAAVEHVMGFLSCSRVPVSEDTLARFVTSASNNAVSAADVTAVVTMARKVLVAPATSGVAVFHNGIALAIRSRYASGQILQKLHKSIADFYFAEAQGPAWTGSATARVEWMYHMYAAGKLDDLCDIILTDKFASLCVLNDQRRDYFEILSLLTLTHGQRTGPFVAMLITFDPKFARGMRWEEASAFSLTSELGMLMHGVLSPGMKTPSDLVRIFTSSTFDDLKVERDALMEKAYPRIRQNCLELGVEFQVVDMRWGIRDESTNDHMTTSICMTEIKECQAHSLGPNFITFLSQRYGYRPFPAEIDCEEFRQLLSHVVAENDQTTLRKWFLLDENRVPSQYVLQPVSTHLPDFLNEANAEARGKARGLWWTDFEAMSLALRKAALSAFKNDTARQLPYVFSVTENEIRNGILKISPGERQINTMWFKRNIVDLDERIAEGDPRVKSFSDLVYGSNKKDEEAAELLKQLREVELPATMPKDLVVEYDVKFAPGKGIDPDDAEHRVYLDKLVNDFVVRLNDSIKMNLQRRPVYGEVHEEALVHLLLAQKRQRTFCGRGAQLAAVRDYLTSSSTNAPMIIHGPSGSGKSTLMAQICREGIPTYLTQNNILNGSVVCRFVGATPASRTLDSLLGSLLRQLYGLVGIHSEIPEESDQLRKEFLEVLMKFGTLNKLLLVIDGLDQLNEADRNVPLNKWLPSHLSPSVRIIISTVVDHKKKIFPSARRLIYGQPGFTNLFLPVPELNSVEATAVIEKVLQNENRTLTATQKSSILAGHEKARSALYLELALQQSKRWASYTKVDATTLALDARGMANALLEYCERIHGKVLVSHCAAFITLAKDGISTSELEDLLSLDDDVLKDIFQYWEPPLRRFPPLLWVRLRREFGDFLVDAGREGLYRWSHDVFAQVVGERYLGRPFEVESNDAISLAQLQADERLRLEALAIEPVSAHSLRPATPQELPFHVLLADYFTGTYADKPKEYTDKTGKVNQAVRQVRQQPLLLKEGMSKDLSNEGHFLYPNVRKLAELPYHLALCKRMSELRDLLLDEVVMDFYAYKRPDLISLRQIWEFYSQSSEDIQKAYLDSFMQFRSKVPDGERNPLRFRLVSYGNKALKLLTSMGAMGPCYDKLNSELWTVKLNALGPSLALVSNDCLWQAMAFVNQGKANEAITLLKQSIELRRKNFAYEHDVCLKAINTLSQVYKRLQMLNEWFTTLLEAVTHLDAVFKNQILSVDAAVIYNNLGEVYLNLQKHTDAVRVLTRARAALESLNGGEAPMLATVANNMGAALAGLQQYPKAEENYALSINYRQLFLGARNPLVGQAMNNLSTLYIQQNRFDEALPLLQRALEIARLSDQPDRDEDIAVVSGNLAGCYQRKGQYQEALSAAELSCKLLRSAPNPNLMLVTQADQSLAAVYCDMRRLPEAEALMRNVVADREKIFGINHAETAKAYECLAICLQEQGKMEECQAFAFKLQAVQAHLMSSRDMFVH